MWIIPKSIQHSFHSAQAYVESSEELNELSLTFEQFVAWRGSLSSSKTWLRRWNQVYWVRTLFGRMLPISQQTNFAEWWTSSQVVIHARENPWLVKDLEKMTQDGSGDILKGQLTLFSLPSASLKMSEDTSQKGYLRSSNRWKNWVTECIGEYSVRRKQAQAIREKEFLLWQSGKAELAWPTPNTMDVMAPKTQKALNKEITETRPGRTQLSNLRDVVVNPVDIMANWPTPTPTTAEANKIPNQANYGQIALSNHPSIVGNPTREKLKKDVKQWPTPTTMENEHNQEKFEARAKRLKERNNGKNGTKYSGNGAGPNLATVASPKWTTPVATDSNRTTQYQQGGTASSMQVNMNWGTPTSRDYKDGTAKSVENVPTNGLLGRMNHSPENTMSQDPDSLNSDGKSQEHQDTPTAYQLLYDQCGVVAGRILRKCWERKYGKKLTLESKLTLNPKWVCQLMGTTFEKTFFVHLETPFTKIPQN